MFVANMPGLKDTGVHNAMPKDKVGATSICRTLKQLVGDGDIFRSIFKTITKTSLINCGDIAVELISIEKNF